MVLLKNNRGSRIVLYICMGLLSLFLAVTILPAFFRTDSAVILFKNSSLTLPSMLIGVFFLIMLLAFVFRRIDRLAPAGDKWLKILLFFVFLLLEIVMIASFQTVLKSDSWKINDFAIYSAINGSLTPPPQMMPLSVISPSIPTIICLPISCIFSIPRWCKSALRPQKD